MECELKYYNSSGGRMLVQKYQSDNIDWIYVHMSQKCGMDPGICDPKRSMHTNTRCVGSERTCVRACVCFVVSHKLSCVLNTLFIRKPNAIKLLLCAHSSPTTKTVKSWFWCNWFGKCLGIGGYINTYEHTNPHTHTHLSIQNVSNLLCMNFVDHSPSHPLKHVAVLDLKPI